MRNAAGDGPFQLAEEAAPIALEEDQVLYGISKLHPDSAPGCSGWTNNAIKFLLFHAGRQEQRDSLGSAITAVFNRMWAGTMPLSVRSLWTRARVVFIPKADGKVRPLGLRDAWYRLCTRIVARKEAGPLGDRIKAFQLAVGVRGGSEIGAHVAQLQTRVEVTAQDILTGDDYVVDSEDGRNCFNELGLGPALVEMRAELPSLCRGFWWFYGAPSELVGFKGNVIGSREIGTAQGCPLSTIICALAYAPVHRRLKAIMAEEEANHPLTPSGDADIDAARHDRGKSCVQMYADDVRLGGRRRVVAATIRRAQAEAFTPAGTRALYGLQTARRCKWMNSSAGRSHLWVSKHWATSWGMMSTDKRRECMRWA
jgi:hypothetical protein